MCVEYGLDGICMDDEYSEYYKAPNNEYFTGSTTSLLQATRLLERTDYYFKKDVPWDTMIAVFYWGYYSSGMPEVNGRKPGEFVQMVNANYGSGASPVAGGDKSMCSFMSVECNLGSGWISEESARQAKEAGYGWCMWFALDPVLAANPGASCRLQPKASTIRISNRARVITKSSAQAASIRPVTKNNQ